MLSKLKLTRLQLGIKQVEVANTLGISKGYLSGIENGAVNLTEDMLYRLANVYGVPAKELV